MEPQKRKIVIMYDSWSEHGGAERIMLFQARTLKKAGYDVGFAFAHVDEKLKKEKLRDFPVIEYSKLPFKNETFQICSSVIRNSHDKLKDFDLAICHYFPSSYTALRLKKKFGIPYILHLHHPPQFLYNADLSWAKNTFKRKFSFALGKIFKPTLRAFDSYCVKNADDYFTESEVVRKIIKNTYGIDGEVLYPTIDEIFQIKKSNFKELAEYNIYKDYILGSGRIIGQKRFDYLIEAFSKLGNKNLQLVFAGKYDNKEKEKLEKLAFKKGIKPIFLGPVDINELVKLYNLAKLTVLTCPKEWFGIVPIEAMACGCPVVAWKDGFGPEETVIDSLNGYLAKPYDMNNMADKIHKALNKKWSKTKIRNSIKNFTEEVQSKILLNKVKKYLNLSSCS